MAENISLTACDGVLVGDAGDSEWNGSARLSHGCGTGLTETAVNGMLLNSNHRAALTGSLEHCFCIQRFQRVHAQDTRGDSLFLAQADASEKAMHDGFAAGNECNISAVTDLDGFAELEAGFRRMQI